MKYITEDDVASMFVVVEESHEGFIYRDNKGWFYIRNNNKMLPISTAFPENGNIATPEEIIIKSKNDIISDIIDEL